MNCPKTRDQFADYLMGDLDEAAREDVQSHISVCPACRKEIETLSAVWTRLGVLRIEQPTEALRARFYSMLESYKDGIREESRPVERPLGTRSSRLWKAARDFTTFKRPAFAMTFSFALLIAGIGIGYFLSSGGSEQRISDLHREVQDMRQMVAVSLMSQRSASDRLKGVSWTAGLANPGEETLQALLDALDSDPNVNVRLAAVDALYLYRKNPLVRRKVTDSLSVQTSPLVQIALVDFLVGLSEQRAAEALKRLVQDEKLNPEVKKRAEQGLERLI